MMDKSKAVQESSSHAVGRSRKDLEEKIKLMWKAIEDLKQKLMEEKEILKKEKCENIKINEEADKLRRHLNMYHLPHCPVHSAPPCPVHSFSGPEQNPQPLAQQEQGDQQPDLQSYKEFIKNLNVNGSEDVDVFEEPVSPTGLDANKPIDDFTLLLSRHWQSRRVLESPVAAEDDRPTRDTDV